MSDSTTYNLLKCTDMRIHAAADVRTTSGASPKHLTNANGGLYSNDSSGLHITDGNIDANENTGFGFKFMVSASNLGLVPGETYVFSAELSSLSTNGKSNGLQVYQHNSDSWWTGKQSQASWASGAGTYHVSFKYDGSVHVYLLFSVGVGGSATVTRFGLYHAASAAWAPAEGEELTGGGALMSANLWDASTANIKPDADGVYTQGKSGTIKLHSQVGGTAALSENQTVHMGASIKGADAGVLKPFVEYRDAAGNLNSTGFPSWQPTDSWQRFEGTCVVPSGMTVCGVGFSNDAATGNIQVANPVFSYGSPVTLASDAHTPYATQDHVAAEYATKAELKVTSDAVKTATTAANKAADRANTAAGNVESIVSGAVATPQTTGVVYIADTDGTTAGTQYNTACSMAFYNTAASAIGELMDAELNGMRDTVAPTEDTGAASRNYAVGEFFYDASHNLCRVTHAVSQGASLVSGTNYTTVSGGVQQYIGTPTYVYATAPSEETVKAAHATPCFVYVVDTASFYYVS